MSESTNKNKKIIVISVISIIVVVLIAGLIWYFNSKVNKEEDILRLNQLYETLQTKDSYSFTTTLDDNNKMYYATQDNKAYINTSYEGTETKFIIKDGNSYLIVDDTKSYYTYNNNETDLNKIELILEEVKDLEAEKGKEKIENKTYSYEEYNILTDFTMQDTSDINANEDIKTRFYFEDNKLVYIKTIIDGKQELLKVEISYNVDNNLFEIPLNYEEM